MQRRNILLILCLTALCFSGVVIAKEHDKMWQGYPRLSPFEAVRWADQVPQAQIAGKWYQVLAINDVPVMEVISFSKSKDEQMWQKRFEEDLVELLTRMGHTPGPTATIEVKELNSETTQTLKDVPMTEENRQALRKARYDREQQDAEK